MKEPSLGGNLNFTALLWVFQLLNSGGGFLNEILAGDHGHAEAGATAPYSPEHNGKAERLNRVLVNAVLFNAVWAEAPIDLWAEALRTANCIRVRSP
jgi:hypothetical protein